jgi:hypothetical protein
MNLTKEQIENLPSGIELDALIAEHVMGWEWVTKDDDQPDAVPYLIAPQIGRVFYPTNSESSNRMVMGLPRYSEDISDAWEVVEKISEKHHWELRKAGRMIIFGICYYDLTGWTDDDREILSGAETAPLAVCRAALFWAMENQRSTK